MPSFPFLAQMHCPKLIVLGVAASLKAWVFLLSAQTAGPYTGQLSPEFSVPSAMVSEPAPFSASSQPAPVQSVVDLPAFISPAHRWRGELTLGQGQPNQSPTLLPWIFYWDGGDTAWTADGELWVPLAVAATGQQRYTISWPFFATYLEVQQAGATLQGLFRDATRDATPGVRYGLPFRAERSQAPLFSGSRLEPTAILPFLGRDWTAVFQDAKGQSPAAARFERSEDGGVQGTFLTPTGDYRYLHGAVVDDTLHLAAMDGSHLFLFRAVVQADGSLQGHFWSGATYHATWTAHRDPDGYVQDPDKLTQLAQPADKEVPFAFCFPDLQGQIR